jgi:serine/threonine protein kinase
MPLSIPDFWKLLLASRLASPVSLSNLQARFAQAHPEESDESNPGVLAQWLVSHGTLSNYQAKVLLAGQPGPFLYGEYTVYDRVASGRLQGCFRALHPSTRHRVMLYFHSGQVVQNAQWWSIVVDQIAQAGKVVHPYAARIYHLVDLGQFKFTSLEDLQGESADAQLAGGPIHWAVAARMVRQAALGLGRMHELKQLHGAIRPENLWIDKEENVKLLLTPLARNPLSLPGPIDLSAPQHSEDILRQADYLAPEMGQADQSPGPWTDIYALGCTLFKLLTGRAPFTGRDVLSKLASHASERIPSLDAASVPAPLVQVLTGMMAKEPARRFQRAKQVSDALTQVLTQLDPAQLEWPPSQVSNKLPEYESWLQPYNLSTDSQKSWAPEVDMPPILAASMRSEQSSRAQQNLPQSPASQSGAGDAASSRKGIGGDPLRTTPSSIRTTPPALPGTGSASGRQPGPGNALSQARGATPSRCATGNSSMSFPDNDAIDPFGSRDLRRSPRGQRRAIYSIGAVAVFIVVVMFLLMSMWAPPEHEPAPVEKEKPTSVVEPRKDLPNAAEIINPEAVDHDKNNSKQAPAGGKQDESKRPAKQSGDSSSIQQSHPSQASFRHRIARFRLASFNDQSDATDRGPSGTPAESNTAGKRSPTDSSSMWASPTHGAPLSLVDLPPGLQAAIFLRPADLMQRADRDKIFAALGPAGESAAREIKSFTGESLGKIEQLVVAWIDEISSGGESSITPVYLFRFREPLDREKLKTRWESLAPVELGQVYPLPDGLAAHLPAKENGNVLIVGSATCVKDVVQLNGATPPVQRPIEKLLTATDDHRLATLLWMPSTIAFTDDRPPQTGIPWRILMQWSRGFLGDDIRAAALSVQLADDNLFLELAVQGPLGMPPESVARQLQERLAKLSPNAARYFVSLNLQPYDKAVLERLPQMISLMNEFTRRGTAGDLAVLRCYLPAMAAHNLLLATELALAESSRANLLASTGGSTAPAAATVAQRLQRVTSLSFARDTLERAIQLLADDIGVKAEIIGPDLQLEGITKNQSFSLDENNQTAAEILGAIMLRANPDGKLVYVVKARQPGDEEMVFITTRAAAKKRGDKLPPELQAAPAK